MSGEIFLAPALSEPAKRSLSSAEGGTLRAVETLGERGVLGGITALRHRVEAAGERRSAPPAPRRSAGSGLSAGTLLSLSSIAVLATAVTAVFFAVVFFLLAHPIGAARVAGSGDLPHHARTTHVAALPAVAAPSVPRPVVPREAAVVAIPATARPAAAVPIPLEKPAVPPVPVATPRMPDDAATFAAPAIQRRISETPPRPIAAAQPADFPSPSAAVGLPLPPRKMSIPEAPPQPIAATQPAQPPAAIDLPAPPARASAPARASPPPTTVKSVLAPAAAPPTASPAPAPGKPHLSAKEIAALSARGDNLLGNGDIISARLFYERAADAGDGRAALRLGATFDPGFLARAGLPGVHGDVAQARKWYRRALALGAADAERWIKALDSTRAVR
jgi:hypothetical protein